jgi:hypothetical protein
MKKKIITIVVLITAFILALPLVGNRVINATLEMRLASLSDYGVSYKIVNEKNSYLTTEERFIFSITDKKKFYAYVQSQAKQQVPPYVSMMLDGMEIAVDTSYANVPIFNTISLDITPYSLPKKMVEDLQVAQPDVYKKLMKLIHDEKLLYHIDYDVVKMYFNGYIKDMNEEIALNNDYNIVINFKNINFNGHGLLMKPRDYKSHIETMYLKMSRFNNTLVVFDLENVNSSGVFDSKIEYKSFLEATDFNLTIKQDRLNNITLYAQDISFNISSSEVHNKIAAVFKNSIKSLDINAFDTLVKVENFNLDSEISDIDKEMFVLMQTSLEQAQNGSKQQSSDEALQYSLGLLSKGLKIDIKNFDIENIFYHDNDIDGFSTKLLLEVLPDDNFGAKLKTPKLLIDNLVVDAKIKIATNFFEFLKSLNPTAILAENFSKKENNSVIFDVHVKDSKIKINDKEI